MNFIYALYVVSALMEMMGKKAYPLWLINNIGVINVGLFAMRPADVVLIGKGTEVITR